ncbi:glycosyltransferase family 2 protein [Halorubrum ezzemoulense]|jgi:glycosyltransferase involved in cell wall biosynthesis|uniref:Glycosyltransferase n=2 Tax=Halorubrum ezzemoulense TaxID=337243 RepID=A0A256JF62_HALEZ|nr:MULTISPECIES: glycosyltransferase family 2 protein [Halorubrum]MDB2225998.1 glycosyltransferase family 2 protein [Halorubrum ezzemoulense]MDB2236807.1 glycosyltransferase family 2 protein [Halorubrum ezzemoulense]MDB2244533.1 glycosyltransferase family 2 protein [Halorubrum ezzemoulense]MDB2247204.1 glycosyltransferase family 2 protein [Halorubrum ezzemoulense]MDB2250740.1 glycosyltransferase family 2 protein [Halorubrum ezzemoulense]
MDDVTVVVPAYDEAGRIGPVVRDLVDEYAVLVVDDGSTDATAAEAEDAGADVVRQPENAGYIRALKRGFREATSEIVVTFDADGEHRPEDVDRLVRPVRDGKLDLVLGARSTIPRPSERLLNELARLKIDVRDSGTGFRALRRELAVSLDLDTACTCGTFVLEAAANGARIGEVPAETRSIQKPRGIAWKHGRQLFHVLRYLMLAPRRS